MSLSREATMAVNKRIGFNYPLAAKIGKAVVIEHLSKLDILPIMATFFCFGIKFPCFPVLYTADILSLLYQKI